MEVFNEIKKLNYANPPEIRNTDDWNKTVQEVKTLIEKSADKTVLANEPSEFTLESTKLPENRFYSDINSAHLECFFKKGNIDYLVVFFSGARSRPDGKLAPYPSFSSWSWYKHVNASILCIDDPMYKTYPEMVIGWYYGNDKEDYRYDTALLIKKISDLLGVPNNHIVLYGRSGGGTAAVAVSDYIEGSLVCSVNAQIDLQKYSYYADQFAQYPKIDIYTSEVFKKRNDFAGIIKRHPENIYLMITNIFSQSDAERSIAYFLKNFNVQAKYGITSDSNFFSLIYSAWGISNAHDSFDSVSLFKIIFEIIIAVSNGVSAEDANILAETANAFWFERFNHLIKRNNYEKEISKLNKQISDMNNEDIFLKEQIDKLNRKFSIRFIRFLKKLFKKA